MFLFRSQERPYLCEESNVVSSVLLCHITLSLCFCISSVNWCTHVVLISYSLPPFDILIVYACTCLYSLCNALCQPKFHVCDNKVLTYLLTYLKRACFTGTLVREEDNNHYMYLAVENVKTNTATYCVYHHQHIQHWSRLTIIVGD